MKIVLKHIINNDTSYNKFATRYLYKTHPDLWQQILDATMFLSETAKPKQRIWHIINEVYRIPLCPITNKEVKWHENRYLETLNPTAAILLQHQRGDFANGHAPEINEKRANSNRGKRVALGTKKPPVMTDEAKQQREKTKKRNIPKKIWCR